MRHKLKAAGLDKTVEVDSAGTYGGHVGEPPDARAQRHAKLRGYDLSRLRARRLTAEDFERFDWVIAWTTTTCRAWPTWRQKAMAHVWNCWMTHARRHPGLTAVPDPYYGPPAGFDHVLDLIEDACDGLMSALASAQPAAPGLKPGRRQQAGGPCSILEQISRDQGSGRFGHGPCQTPKCQVSRPQPDRQEHPCHSPPRADLPSRR